MSGPNVRLAEPLKSQAATLARSRGQSLNAFVAEAVRAYLAGSLEQDPVAATDGPSVAGGRSASPKPEGNGKKPIRSGRYELQVIACPLRAIPPGLLGADVYVEWQRSIRQVQYAPPKPGAWCHRRQVAISEI